MRSAHFILFVQDPERSKRFYMHVLDKAPRLNVPGMIEFALTGGAVLGLMRASAAARLLGHEPPAQPCPPQAELYLMVDSPATALARAMQAGAQLVSPLQTRDWGHQAGYVSDPDGHIVAFAALLVEPLSESWPPQDKSSKRP